MAPPNSTNGEAQQAIERLNLTDGTLSGRVAKARREMQLSGILSVARIDLIVWLRRILVERLLRRIAAPSLMGFMARSSQLYLSPERLLTEVVGAVADNRLLELDAEFDALKCELANRYAGLRANTLSHPTNWAIEGQASRLLYFLVRLLRPLSLVETGVANGHSTFFLLNALAKNGVGRLVSVDVRADVGRLLLESERSDWRLCVLDRGNRRDGFRDLITNLPPIDLFFHDSEHSYSWQHFEYSVVAGNLNNGGLIVSDDVEGSYAFLDFCARIGVQPSLLLDGRKALGLASAISSRNSG